MAVTSSVYAVYDRAKGVWLVQALAAQILKSRKQTFCGPYSTSEIAAQVVEELNVAKPFISAKKVPS